MKWKRDLIKKEGGGEERRRGETPTMTISFPFARLKAFVHRTFLGFLFILKFL